MTREERRQRREAVANRLSSGDDPTIVAKDAGISVARVYDAAKEFGVTPTSVANNRQVRTLEVLKRLLDGVSTNSIITEFRISKQRLSAIKRDAEKAGFRFYK